MKNLFVYILSALFLVGCSDYDSKFDQLDNRIKELADANTALEAQLNAMAALNASVNAQTSAKLAEFQTAVTAIVATLQTLGTASAATIAQVSAIIEAISDLADLVASNTASAAEIAASLEEIQAMIDIINTNVLHHSGGGSTAGTGSEHHSGGGSSDDTTSEATGTDYLPVYTGVFGGAVYGEGGVFTFPTTAESWGGFANDNADIYPLTFSNGGTITFTASSAGADVGVKFKFEANPFPNTTPEFYTEVVTVSGATATEYSVTIPSQGTNTFNSALLYLTVQGVAVTITDIVINVAD